MRLRRRPARPRQETACRGPADAPAADTYLTDGRSLFRVAGKHLDVDHELVELEDCRTLELLLLTAGDAAGLGLHPVGRSRSRR